MASPKTNIALDAEIDSIRASWSTVATQCGQTDSSLGMFLSQATPMLFENHVLSLQFSNNGQGQLAKSMCEKKLAAIEKALSGMFSTNVKVRLMLEDTANTAPKEKTSETPAEAATSQVNRQQRQEALNDPVVQMVLKGLDAMPLEIQKIDIRMDEEQMDIAVEE
jgi:hypothetical protein